MTVKLHIIRARFEAIINLATVLTFKSPYYYYFN